MAVRRHLHVVKRRVPRGRRNVLDALRGYLNAQEPRVVRWLYATWNAERGAITYQELRDAILAGDLSPEYLRRWQEDYARLVNEKLAPLWIDAMEAASRRLEREFDGFVFDPSWPAVRRWVDEHGSELAVNLSKTQHEALRNVIQRAATLGEFGPDELSRVIRPLVGMTPGEALAVQRYYEALRKDGMKADLARKRCLDYAGRVHRHRAMRIARTELAFAYNEGAAQGVRQAQAQGLVGPVKKVWLTGDDERVCEVCGPLDGVKVGQDDDFPGGYRLPPAHPHCRCAVAYEEDVPEVKPAKPETTADRVRARVAEGVETDFDAIEVGEMLDDEIERQVADLRIKADAAEHRRQSLWHRACRLDDAGAPDAERKAAWAEYRRASDEAYRLLDELRTRRAEATRNLLSEVRELGNPGVQAWAKGTRTKVKDAVAEAGRYLPTDWLERSNSSPMLGKIVRRGYYGRGIGGRPATIALSGRSPKALRKTALHEMGHRFEDVVPGVLELERRFYDRRTAGEQPRWLGPGYGRHERTRPDRFVDPYIGKDYGGRSYELLSMGLEALFLGRPDLSADPEYRRFVLGVLASL